MLHYLMLHYIAFNIELYLLFHVALFSVCIVIIFNVSKFDIALFNGAPFSSYIS